MTLKHDNVHDYAWTHMVALEGMILMERININYNIQSLYAHYI